MKEDVPGGGRPDLYTHLQVIQEGVGLHCDATIAAHAGWPCRKGCDDCCRSLASPPRVTKVEWQLITAALNALPAHAAESVRQRIRNSAGAPRPVVCPLLDTNSGTCLVYETRPVACRTYGFYAERRDVLGCSRIESIARQSPDVVWGNHTAMEERMRPLGSAVELSAWLAHTSDVLTAE